MIGEERPKASGICSRRQCLGPCRLGAALKASLWAGQRDGPAGSRPGATRGVAPALDAAPRTRLGREARREIGERSARAQPTAGPRGRVARAITLPPPGVTLDSPAARRRGPCGPEVDRRRRNAAALGDGGANEYSCDRAAQLSLRPKGAASQRQLRVRNGWRTACLTARYGGSGVRAHATRTRECDISPLEPASNLPANS